MMTSMWLHLADRGVMARGLNNCTPLHSVAVTPSGHLDLGNARLLCIQGCLFLSNLWAFACLSACLPAQSLLCLVLTQHCLPSHVQRSLICSRSDLVLASLLPQFYLCSFPFLVPFVSREYRAQGN